MTYDSAVTRGNPLTHMTTGHIRRLSQKPIPKGYKLRGAPRNGKTVGQRTDADVGG